MGIKEICWDKIPAQLRSNVFPEDGHLFAFWPSPVDHDICFKNAGFTEFEDSDDLWDDNYSDMIQIFFSYFQISSYLKGLLQLVSHNDNYPYFKYSSESPFNICIVVGDGHPIIWIWMEKDLTQDLFKKLEKNKPVKRVILDWRVLMP